jgi:Protein of unknown function (DUF2442)
LLYRIDQAVAHLDHSVTVIWTDGMRADVDLAPVLAQGPIFAPLRNAAFFVASMKIADDRLGLQWPDGVDFSADGLRARAFLS